MHTSRIFLEFQLHSCFVLFLCSCCLAFCSLPSSFFSFFFFPLSSFLFSFFFLFPLSSSDYVYRAIPKRGRHHPLTIEPAKLIVTSHAVYDIHIAHAPGAGTALTPERRVPHRAIQQIAMVRARVCSSMIVFSFLLVLMMKLYLYIYQQRLVKSYIFHFFFSWNTSFLLFFLITNIMFSKQNNQIYLYS